MPWTPSDAKRKTRKASTPRKQRQWAHVANAMLAKGLPEGHAISQASGVVKNTR